MERQFRQCADADGSAGTKIRLNLMAKLYIVPTPIGNLDDITLRAVNVLREVDFILAEDTRTTSVLLKHFGIEKRLQSHHKFNEHATVRAVAETIAAGRSAAIVSDAGTPGISDPGFCWCALVSRRESMWKHCPVPRRLYQLWCKADSRATVFVSRVFSRRRRGVPSICSHWLKKRVRWFFTNRPIGWCVVSSSLPRYSGRSGL